MTRFLNFLLVGLFGTYFYLEYRESNAVDASPGQATLVAKAVVDADAAPLRAETGADPVKVALVQTPDTVVASDAEPVIAEGPVPEVLSDAEIRKAKDLFAAQRLTALPVEVAVVAEPEPQPTAAPTVLEVTGSVVNARSGPGTGYDVLTRLTRGTSLYATDETDGSWVKVMVAETGQEVWMHSGFLGEAG